MAREFDTHSTIPPMLNPSLALMCLSISAGLFYYFEKSRNRISSYTIIKCGLFSNFSRTSSAWRNCTKTCPRCLNSSFEEGLQKWKLIILIIFFFYVCFLLPYVYKQGLKLCEHPLNIPEMANHGSLFSKNVCNPTVWSFKNNSLMIMTVQTTKNCCRKQQTSMSTLKTLFPQKTDHRELHNTNIHKKDAVLLKL